MGSRGFLPVTSCAPPRAAERAAGGVRVAAAGHPRRGQEREPRVERKSARAGGQRRRPPQQARRGFPPRINQPGYPAGFRGAPRRVCAGTERAACGAPCWLRSRLRSPAGRTALIPPARSHFGAGSAALGNCCPSGGSSCATGHPNIY